MASRVVSTKVNEIEHGKILQLCNQKGLTVSTLLKQAILERIDDISEPKKELTKKSSVPTTKPPEIEKPLVKEDETDSDRYLYF